MIMVTPDYILQHGNVVEIFLSQNVIDVDIRGQEGWSPLMCAAHADHLRIVKMLVHHGASLNQRTDSGWTALMLSAWLGHIKTACFLLEAGADRDIEDNGDGLDLIDPWSSLPLRNIEDKWTALRCAQSQRNNAIAVILGKETLNKQNEIKKALLTATESGCPTILANFLQRGANLDVAKNEHGETAFQITAKFPQIKMEAYKEHIKELKRKKTNKPYDKVLGAVQHTKLIKACKSM